MPDSTPRPSDVKRWRSNIVRHLEDFPRQYGALETAMSTFGDDFDLRPFRAAFLTTEDLEAYNRVQAVERALGRVQNYVADLSSDGVRLANVPLAPMEPGGSAAQQAFDSLRDVGVITGALCRRLKRAQGARSRIEHSYVDTPAGDVHRATRLVHETARTFIAPYTDWITPFLIP